MNNEIRELTLEELDEVNGAAGLSFNTGWAQVDMAWGAKCKMVVITTNNGTQTSASTC